MRSLSRGFTLVELILVLAILGILASVANVAVVGLVQRGEEEAYDIDGRTIQMAVANFYSDVHKYHRTLGWNETGGHRSVHNYPTESGMASSLYPASEATELNGYTVYKIEGFSGSTAADRLAEIQDAAIWMGLLVNAPGSGAGGADITPGDGNSPLADEHGPYLNPLPDSCSLRNSSAGQGTITWIAGKSNSVYGVYDVNGVWYTGFGGRYP